MRPATFTEREVIAVVLTAAIIKAGGRANFARDHDLALRDRERQSLEFGLTDLRTDLATALRKDIQDGAALAAAEHQILESVSNVRVRRNFFRCLSVPIGACDLHLAEVVLAQAR